MWSYLSQSNFGNSVFPKRTKRNRFYSFFFFFSYSPFVTLSGSFYRRETCLSDPNLREDPSFSLPTSRPTRTLPHHSELPLVGWVSCHVQHWVGKKRRLWVGLDSGGLIGCDYFNVTSLFLFSRPGRGHSEASVLVVSSTICRENGNSIGKWHLLLFFSL